MKNSENKTEVPKLQCKGCEGRDNIIKSLAAEVDRLQKLAEQPKAKKLKKAA